ncbi:MAG: Ig-like domain-containing protein, partial [Roseburia faecis]|nr:Ig-like domain-containing protein [Roseburia faecis]
NTDKGYCDLVYSYMEATSIKFTKPTLTMKKNTTAQATVKMGPNGCTDRKSFTSSNPKVVAVNKKTGKLTAKKVGKATITVTTGSGRKAKMKVVVK